MPSCIPAQSHLRAKYRKRTQTITCSVEDVYLREDVPCGVADGACRHCSVAKPLQNESMGTSPSSSLEPNALAYLIPDAATLDAFLEVLLGFLVLHFSFCG